MPLIQLSEIRDCPLKKELRIRKSRQHICYLPPEVLSMARGLRPQAILRFYLSLGSTRRIILRLIIQKYFNHLHPLTGLCFSLITLLF
jgi:hypothetical protein